MMKDGWSSSSSLVAQKGDQKSAQYLKSMNLFNMPPGYSYSSQKVQECVSGFRRWHLCFSDDVAEANKQGWGYGNDELRGCFWNLSKYFTLYGKAVWELVKPCGLRLNDERMVMHVRAEAEKAHKLEVSWKCNRIVSRSPSGLKFSSVSFLTLAGRRHAKDYQPEGIRTCKALGMVITMTSYINNHLIVQLILTVCCQGRKYKKKISQSRKYLQSKSLQRKEHLKSHQRKKKKSQRGHVP